MLNIHERYKCGVPVIIEGETGVGKTALVEMLSKLWNQSLLLEWKRQRSRILDFFQRRLGDMPREGVTTNYEVGVVYLFPTSITITITTTTTTITTTITLSPSPPHHHHPTPSL